MIFHRMDDISEIRKKYNSNKAAIKRLHDKRKEKTVAIAKLPALLPYGFRGSL